MIVLGYHGGIDPFLSGGRHSAAAIVERGRVLAACEEERFVRERRAHALPERAFRCCLRAAGLASLDAVDLVACAESEFDAWRGGPSKGGDMRRLTRWMLRATGTALRGIDRVRAPRAERARAELCALGTEVPAERFVTVPHAVAHAASTFFTSPFERALCFVAGPSALGATATAALGRGARLEVVEQRLGPDGLGALCAFVARYLGLEPGQEHELAALAAHGDPAHHRRYFRGLVRLRRDGIAEVDSELALRLALRDALAPCGALYPRAMSRALGPARRPGEPLQERHAHVAAALQETLEMALVASLAALRARTGERDVCLGGDLALNPAANARIARSGMFARVHVPPAVHEAGTALGAALYAQHHLRGVERADDAMPTPYLGACADDELVDRSIAIFAGAVRAVRTDDVERKAAEAIAQGRLVGWFQGRAEWGRFALGGRSVLADPRRPESAARVRAAIGARDAIDALSPAVPLECAAEWFDMSGVGESPHLMFSVPVRRERRTRIPAVVHVDGTARVQTVSWEQCPRFHALLHAFGMLTGIPVLINAGFAADGEPLVNTPEDALRSFLATELDALVIGDRWIERRSSNAPVAGHAARAPVAHAF